MWPIIITVATTATLVVGQSYPLRSSQDAAILSDARYLSGDGTFGSAYSQEDGVVFKEESDANGDRKGSYSYVDPSGRRRTVFYTAGRNGFQATGDHIPTARPVVAPKPEYEPLPQFNPPEYRPPERRFPAESPKPRFYYYNRQASYQPEPQPEYQSRRQYRPPPPSSQPRYRPEPQARDEPRPETRHRPAYRPDSEYRSQFHYQPRPSPPPRYDEVTTFSPRRYYPPGNLEFNRTWDGFSYKFNKS